MENNKQQLKQNYEIINRFEQDSSVKYDLTLQGICKDKLNINQILILSYADMQFKFAPKILKQLFNSCFNISLGYTKLSKENQFILKQWVIKRYYNLNLLSNYYLRVYPGMLSVYFTVLNCFTCQNDSILFFTPCYYRFILTTKNMNRKPIQYQLNTINNRFMIDFQQLDQLLSKQKPKLIVLLNPHNPSGRIWSHEQLENITKLIVKYKILVFSDQVFSDSILNHQQFTSMLQFESVRPYLIYGNSFTKAFNCSGVPFTYTFTFSNDISQKMSQFADNAYYYPSTFSYKLLKYCYTNGQQWLRQTTKYINQNYNYFLSECTSKLPELIIYPMQCSYLVLVDFQKYNAKGQVLKDFFHNIQIYPTFMENAFIKQTKRSFVRFNIGCNRSIIVQFINRIVSHIGQIK